VLLLFDHSCGHGWQREDGLNVENMSKSYGGKQQITLLLIIRKKGGVLDDSTANLNLVIHSIFFSRCNEGPFWMNNVEREKKWHDNMIEGQFTNQKLKGRVNTAITRKRC
jgi:hypothetical protein